MLDVIEALADFSNIFPKELLLKECIKRVMQGNVVYDYSMKNHTKKLKLTSDTKWVERHTSLFDFQTLFTDLLDCFEVIRNNKDEDRKWERKSITEANGFRHNISNPSIIVALNCATFVFDFTSTVVNKLQRSSMEIMHVYQAIRLNIEELQAIVENAYFEFHKMFVEIEAMEEKCGKTIKPKRRSGRQLNTENYEGTPENHFEVPSLHHTLIIRQNSWKVDLTR